MARSSKKRPAPYLAVTGTSREPDVSRGRESCGMQLTAPSIGHRAFRDTVCHLGRAQLLLVAAQSGDPCCWQGPFISLARSSQSIHATRTTDQRRPRSARERTRPTIKALVIVSPQQRDDMVCCPVRPTGLSVPLALVCAPGQFKLHDGGSPHQT